LALQEILWVAKSIPQYIYTVVSYVKQYPPQNFANKEVPFSLSFSPSLESKGIIFRDLVSSLPNSWEAKNLLYKESFFRMLAKQGKTVFSVAAKEWGKHQLHNKKKYF
jgi:hypothetical protein